MKKTIAKFQIEYLQALNEKGVLDRKNAPKVSKELLLKMYELMVLSRVFDEKCFSLQRQGKIGTYAPMKGQEATQIGSALALGKQDWIFPSYRENGVYIALDYPMHKLLQYWGGDKKGMQIEKTNIMPVTITVGAQPLHAVGYAYAFKLRKEKKIVATFFGDGATSQGDLNEALNFSGVLGTGNIFICSNNQYAISVSRNKQSAAQTLAQKAIAAGIKGIQIDGNDVLAVYKTVKEAREKALKGKPVFIECYTYRLSDHTTADDASRYRSKKELQQWKKKDPIERLSKYLKKKKWLSKEKEKKILEEAKKKVEEETAKYESLEMPKPEEMFQYLYEKIPKELEKQKKEMQEWLSENKAEEK